MKRILVDLTFILNEQDLKKSTSVYVQRLLDALEQDDYKRNKFIFLLRKSLLDYFSKKYQRLDSDFILFSESKYINISFLKSIYESLLWKRQINSINCDVVYVPFTWIYNALKINKRKITTIHDLRPIRETRIKVGKKLVLGLFRHYFNIAVKNANLVITISNFVKNDVISEFNCPDKIRVIYNGIPLNVLCTEIAVLKNQRFLLYVNTLTPYKNVLTLIKAFNTLQDSNLLLVIVGKETEYWKEKCLSENTDKIIRLDYVTDSELAWLYRNAELFVTTSMHEGFGFTPIEAAVQCCPVISTRADSLPEVTRDSVYYYEPFDDSDALSAQISRVLKDRNENPEQFDKKMKAVSEMFKETYSLSTFKESILKLLEGQNDD